MALNLPKSSIKEYQRKLLSWYAEYGRKFPWRETKDPYKILVAELLLQKTNSRAVGIVYSRFIKKYPTPAYVIEGSKEEIYQIISPLGLFYRAERIYEICYSIVKDYNGEVPKTEKDLIALKGVGRYVASAVLCFGFNRRKAILDQNVIKVLSRMYNLRSEKQRIRDDKNFWLVAQYLIPKNNFREYNYALLDF